MDVILGTVDRPPNRSEVKNYTSTFKIEPFDENYSNLRNPGYADITHLKPQPFYDYVLD